MTPVERVSRLTQSSDSYGRTDGLTETSLLTHIDQSSTLVPRASKTTVDLIEETAAA